MFELGKKYKIEYEKISYGEPQLITYTGTITDQNQTHLKILTIRNETIILSIEEIKRSTELKEGE